MSLCVLDASYTFQWLFEDEAPPDGDAALAAVRLNGALVPSLWFVEIANGPGIAERRSRVNSAQVAEGLHLLRSIPLTVDEQPTLASSDVILELMRAHRLTAYDATYLELALRRGLLLATRDKALCLAAAAVRVGLLQVVARPISTHRAGLSPSCRPPHPASQAPGSRQGSAEIHTSILLPCSGFILNQASIGVPAVVLLRA